MSPEPFEDRKQPDDGSADLRDSMGNRPEAYFADGPGGRYCVRREPVMTLPAGTQPGYGRLEDLRMELHWQAEFHCADPGPLSLGLPLVLYKGESFEEACAACDSDYDRRQRAWLWAQTHANTDPITEDRIRELIREELAGRDLEASGMLMSQEQAQAMVDEFLRQHGYEPCHTPEGDSGT